MNPFSQIPANIRKWAYLAYTLVLTGLGATQVGFATAQAGQPIWLSVSFAVMGYLGIAFGFTAASNIKPTD